MYTKSDYMAKRCSHADYYRQFVSSATIQRVRDVIGAHAIRKSTDPHMNDIPLKKWDALAPYLPLARSFASVGDTNSLASRVCVAKQAARMIDD